MAVISLKKKKEKKHKKISLLEYTEGLCVTALLLLCCYVGGRGCVVT